MKTLRLTKLESAAYANGERRFWREVKPGRNQRWLRQSSIDNSPGGCQWTDKKGQLWRQFYHPEAGKFSYGVQHAPDSPLTSIKCPFGSPGDRIWIREYSDKASFTALTDSTITAITVEQRGGRWGWVVEVRA